MEKATSSFRFPPKQLSKTCLQDVFKSGKVCRIRVVNGYLDSEWVEDVSNSHFNSIAYKDGHIYYCTGDGNEPNLKKAKDCYVKITVSTNELCKYQAFSRGKKGRATIEKGIVVFEVNSVYCERKKIRDAAKWIIENWYDRGAPLSVPRN